MAFLIRSVDPQKTISYPLDGISPDLEKPITVHLFYIGAGNTAWKNAISKLEAGLRGLALQEAIAALFADIAVSKIENLTEDGQPVEYTRDVAKRFLNQLVQPLPLGDPDAFERMFAAASNPNNYRPPVAAASAVGKG